MNDSLSKTLLDLIPKLPAATGDYSFEGLIQKLLKIFTERHFHPAKTGYQAGRDISSRLLFSNTIFVECKRYKKTTELNERELLGELHQAKDETPDLDIWVLVTSRNVDSKLYESLHRKAAQDGIDFAVIAAGDGEPSSLAVLCANSPATVIGFLKSVASDGDLPKLENELNKITRHPQFFERVNQLKEKFLSPLVGYENWRIAQTRIERQLKSSAPGDFSQAVTMLAFLETDKAIEQLKDIAKNQPDTWRKLSMDISVERWQRNSWAKHWFGEFLDREDRIMAWRGFKLFLQCVDKRFWLWKEKLITEASSHNFHQEYLNFLEDNEDTIKNAIRNSKYNQELDKTFLCHKTS